MQDIENLSQEEQDNLLRQEMQALEDSNSESGTNDSETQVEVQEEAQEQSEEVDTQDATEEESQPTEEKPKKKSNVAKILSEKNEWKRKALEAEERMRELESNL